MLIEKHYFKTKILTKSVSSALLVIAFSKALKWLYKYIRLVIRVNKIPSPLSMLPFIGNAHQVESGPG